MAIENYGRVMQSAADFAMMPYNALQDSRKAAAQNKLMDLRTQQIQNELDDDAEWDAAYAKRDWDTLRRIDPQTAETLYTHEQQRTLQERMAGLEDIPISRQKIDMAPLQRQENWAYEQARAQRNADRTYRLDAAQEARLSRPQAGGEDEFARYQAMTPQQRALYNEFKGRPNTLPGPGEVAPTASVSGFGTLPTGTKLTEVQGKNYLGASIMAENIPVLTAALRDGYVPTRQDLFAVGPPLKGALNTVAQELTPREKANPKANDYFNAGSKILTAILRPESGGAITEDEWTMYGPMYLPWPGDSETTRTRKMVSLNAYMKRLAQVSGPASGYFTGAEQVQDEQIIDLPPRAR